MASPTAFLFASLFVVTFLTQVTSGQISNTNEETGQVKPGSLASPAPEGLLRVTQTMTITQLPVDKLDKFLTKRDWVVRLVDCLVDIGYCNMKFGLALHEHLNAVNEGADLCPHCTRLERVEQLRGIIRFIAVMQRRYKAQWQRVEKQFNFFRDTRI